jgi:hypothetical protein
MKTLFAPGCAMMLYKPHLADIIYTFLNKNYDCTGIYTQCCHHTPDTAEQIRIINTCPGCDRRFGSLYPNVSTISLWEVVSSCDNFPYPDHGGMMVSVHDACPTRTKPAVHSAVRDILHKMNIQITESAHSGTNAVCCGDTYHGRIPLDEVCVKMRQRASEMPEENVAVYCVSCVKAMEIGGKTPKYLPDLLFNEPTHTLPQTLDQWHDDINQYIKEH